MLGRHVGEPADAGSHCVGDFADRKAPRSDPTLPVPPAKKRVRWVEAPKVAGQRALTLLRQT